MTANASAGKETGIAFSGPIDPPIRTFLRLDFLR
jgi:hypothetical protein